MHLHKIFNLFPKGKKKLGFHLTVEFVRPLEEQCGRIFFLIRAFLPLYMTVLICSVVSSHVEGEGFLQEECSWSLCLQTQASFQKKLFTN